MQTKDDNMKPSKLNSTFPIGSAVSYKYNRNIKVYFPYNKNKKNIMSRLFKANNENTIGTIYADTTAYALRSTHATKTHLSLYEKSKVLGNNSSLLGSNSNIFKLK